MAFLGQERYNLFLGCADGLIGNHVHQVRHAQLRGSGIEPVADFLLEHFRHPDHAQQPAVSHDEFPLADIIFTVSHKTGSADSAADCACESREFHAARCHPGILTVDGHNPVA